MFRSGKRRHYFEIISKLTKSSTTCNGSYYIKMQKPVKYLWVDIVITKSFHSTLMRRNNNLFVEKNKYFTRELPWNTKLLSMALTSNGFNVIRKSIYRDVGIVGVKVAHVISNNVAYNMRYMARSIKSQSIH